MELNSTATQLLNQLSGLHRWEDRYRALLQLDKDLPRQSVPHDEAHAVAGCQSPVWLALSGTPQAMHISTDSDARLVRSLLYLMTAPVQGASQQQLSEFDFQGWLTACGLADHLSASRVNGLYQVILALQQRALKNWA
ncbi:MAG: SufE family protein [Idiomarina sp.]|nr:SufE family protein [Idiomarina sp.]